MKSLSGGVKCATAVSLAGSLIFGGMVVTSVHVAGAKTNDTNQIENGKWRMENAGGRTTILRSPFSILHSASSVTDDDIARRWRVVSVSSNPVDASVFAIEQSNNQTIEQSPVVWEAAQRRGLRRVARAVVEVAFEVLQQPAEAQRGLGVAPHLRVERADRLQRRTRVRRRAAALPAATRRFWIFRFIGYSSSKAGGVVQGKV